VRTSMRTQQLTHKETSRTYVYADGQRIVYTNVVGFGASDSGNHYLDTEDGLRHIVAPGWRAVDIETEEWSA